MVEEETSMKKSKNIIILVVVLGLLIGAYYLIGNKPQDEEDDFSDTAIELSKFDKEKLTKMTLKTSEGTLTLTKEGEEWKVDYPYDIVLDESAIDDLAYSFASLYAEEIVEEAPEDLSEYGLDKPQAIAECELEDGEKRTFYLGDKTPVGNTYYLMVEGDPKVYTVWTNHGEHFTYSLSDIREKKLPEIDMADLKYLKIDKKDGRPIEIKVNDDQSEEEASFGLGIWKMTSPYNQPMGVDGNSISSFLEAISTLSIKDFIDDAPADLGTYGLKEPKGEVIIKDSEKKLHIYIGEEYDDETVYFKTDDGDSVYTIEKSKLEFMDIKPFELVEKFAYIVNIDDVDKIVVEGGGKSHTLTLTRTIQEAEGEDEDEEDEVITTYKVDGKEVEEDSFKKYYQSLIGLIVDAENNEEPNADPEVKTTFFLNKGKEREVHVDYVPYDKDFYLVVRNGKAEFLISQKQVKNMLNDLELLIEGKLKK